MNEKEMAEQAINEYINLQRIKTANDKEKELNYQLQALEIKLSMFGVADIDKLKL